MPDPDRGRDVVPAQRQPARVPTGEKRARVVPGDADIRFQKKGEGFADREAEAELAQLQRRASFFALRTAIDLECVRRPVGRHVVSHQPEYTARLGRQYRTQPVRAARPIARQALRRSRLREDDAGQRQRSRDGPAHYRGQAMASGGRTSVETGVGPADGGITMPGGSGGGHAVPAGIGGKARGSESAALRSTSCAARMRRAVSSWLSRELLAFSSAWPSATAARTVS